MIYCNNDTCVWCKRDYLGELRCTGHPIILQTRDSLMDHNVICGSYTKRDGPLEVPEIHPGRGPNGLFPGQLKGVL